jgi:hypothetical protein
LRRSLDKENITLADLLHALDEERENYYQEQEIKKRE